jgi:hypothetical protein
VKYYFLDRVVNSRFLLRIRVCRVLPFCAAFAVPLLFSSVAGAALSGDASLTYSSYDGSARSADGKGRTRMSSSSLVQDYSLLYSTSGPIYNSRVGSYDVSLGYNWTALDTTFKSSSQPNENYNETRGHLLYSGEIKIDPKEVPFRLNAYSRDTTRNSVITTNGFSQENFASQIGSRDQAFGINDGLHIETGATLIAGVKNGMTNGYNEILRHFPMILVDYKDTINRDYRSQNPVDERLSRLAFVSLNKKDNWFHYRHTLYENYFDTQNNYVENEVQIGTVDQNMARRWIDFSNWIKVSTDLQLSKRKSNYMANAIENINLNLFVSTERRSWNARTFTSFNRNVDEYQKLSYQASLPVYAAGDVSQDLSWNARTSFRNNHDLTQAGVDSTFTNVLAGYRVDAYKRALFTVSQNFDIESSKTYVSDYLTVSGGLETASTARFSRNINLGAAYSIKNTSTSDVMNSKSNFLEQNLEFRGGYTPTNTLRFEIRQRNSFTNGTLVPFNGTTNNSDTLLGQYINPRNVSNSSVGTQSYHSLSSLLVNWNPKPRLVANLTLNEDIYKSNVYSTSAVTEVLSTLSFSSDSWTVRDEFAYTHGSKDSWDANADALSNGTFLSYIHNRSLDASAGVKYSYFSPSNGDSINSISLEQKLNYKYFTKSGVVRKLLEFNETLMYSEDSRAVGNMYPKSLMLGCKYYPISQLALSAGAGYSFTTSISDYSLVWNASAALNFRLLQASLDYVHGVRKTDGARESKFTGNIRKSF